MDVFWSRDPLEAFESNRLASENAGLYVLALSLQCSLLFDFALRLVFLMTFVLSEVKFRAVAPHPPPRTPLRLVRRHQVLVVFFTFSILVLTSEISLEVSLPLQSLASV